MHYNNVYAIERGGVRILVDTGPDYAGAWEELRAALGAFSPAVVVATHGHSDHAGLGSAWIEAGAEVWLGAQDTSSVRAPGLSAAEARQLAAWVDTAGTPPEVAAEAVAGLGRRVEHGVLARAAHPPAGPRPHWPTGLRFRPFEPSRLLDAAELVAAGVEVIPAPGHTPGNVVVFDHEGRALFSGDTLLPDITPTPPLQFDPAGHRIRSLPAFADSLQALSRLRPARCYPGHGEPFDDVAGTIARDLAAIEQRSERVLAALRDEGPGTTYELAERLYPRALRRRFWQIMPTIQGQLDLLEHEGRLRLAAGGSYELR